jgi:hypothetical protein
MLEKLVFIETVGQVAFIRTVMIQSPKRRGIDGEMHRLDWECPHDLDAIPKVRGIVRGYDLFA